MPFETLHDTFETDLNPRWHITETGNAQVIRRPGSLHLTVLPGDDETYSNAQISTFDEATRNFQLRPPLRLQVTAYSSAPADNLVGTAGFGVWNHAFDPTRRGVRLPQALWFFFGAPPNHMPLALDGAAHGWKAATFNPQRLFYWLLPTMPLAIPLMHIEPLYRRLWPIGQRALGVSEAVLDADMLTTQHTYTLDWLPGKAVFSVDDEIVQTTTHAIPDTPLGFVAWMDTQYAIVSPKGRFGWGLSAAERSQSLVLQDVRIEQLTKN
jgi:hypothetical protein